MDISILFIIAFIIIIIVVGLIVYLIVRSSKNTRKGYNAYQQTMQNQPETYQGAPASKPAFAQDTPSMGLAVLGFFFPLVGLIIYVAWLNTLPFRARSAGKGALAGTIVYIVGGIISFLVMTMFIFR